MESITIYSHELDMTRKIQSLITPQVSGGAEVQGVDPEANLLEFLQFEIPELVIMHFNPAEHNYKPLFDQLEDDPWLESIGFLCIWPRTSDELMDEYRGYNISWFIEEGELERTLPRILDILRGRQDLINHAGIIQKITSLSGELQLETNLLLVPYYAVFFSHFLYRGGYITWEKKSSLRLALSELLINAMEHGNAGLTHQEKTNLQEQGESLQSWVELQMLKPEFKGRKVQLQYHISPVSSHFTIIDEGDGFNVSKYLNSSIDLELSHGRGILLSKGSVQNLEYNEKGNQVSFELLHDGQAERFIPTGFIETEPRLFIPGETVFYEKDSTDYLYYIVSGEYEVSIQGRPITRLTSQDIFMGEMSFLLGNRRSATVKTLKAGKLIPIDRQTFTRTVKSYPNYAIFLSKLLARRLKEANLRYVGYVEYVQP